LCRSVFYSWRKLEYSEKTIDMSHVTDNLYPLIAYTSPWMGFELATFMVIGTACIATNSIAFWFYMFDEQRNETGFIWNQNNFWSNVIIHYYTSVSFFNITLISFDKCKHFCKWTARMVPLGTPAVAILYILTSCTRFRSWSFYRYRLFGFTCLMNKEMRRDLFEIKIISDLMWTFIIILQYLFSIENQV
jgi:hypothetical protein